jgi:voltage-gated potassium channel
MQLALAFGLICATVVIHALGTLEAMTHLSRKWKQSAGKPRLLASEIMMARVVSVLLFLHLVEAGVWAGLFVISGILPDLETALYFSITSYTTVGYGDVVLPVSWRILGPIEAGVGILMFGWSTGIIVTALNRVYRNRLLGSLEQPDDPA